jgi:hypothetical protein
MAGEFNFFGKDGFFGNIGQVGTAVGGLGQAYSAIRQDKAAREMLDLQKQYGNEENKRRNRTQLALDQSFANLTPVVLPTLPL